MRILLYNPDNGVTHNFMPHLWMFLLKTLTPAEHEVLLIDGNARPMDEKQLVEFIRTRKYWPGRDWSDDADDRARVPDG